MIRNILNKFVMKKSLSKNSLIIFLLFHGIFINLLLFPGLFIYSKFYSVDYLSLGEWTKSVCLNLISWQVVSYSLKSTEIQKELSTLKFELSMFSSLVMINQFLLSILSRKKTRKILFSSLIWFIIIINLLLPVTASIFFNNPISLITVGLLFISFQITTFIIYYLNYYFPQDLEDKELPLSSPWFLEVLINGLASRKMA